jgi:uncharacterized heparinase superfamily protein
VRRELHFARHIPLRQLMRRIQLTLRRRAERKLRPRLAVPEVKLADDAPLPLFARAASQTRRTPEGWQFTFLGKTASCGPELCWSLPGPGEQLWTMNLHYFEHAEALPDDQWSDLARQWIGANLPYSAGSSHAGWNAYALSLRVASWLQQLAVRRSSLDEDTVALVSSSAAAQLRYLERHLETDIGGNHLFKNILALLWGSAALESPRASRWRDLGLRLLRRELSQILPDGVHFERSLSYHAQIVGDCLNIRRALGGDPIGGSLDRAIASGLQAAADLSHGDGLPAQFGDSGLHMAHSPAALAGAAAGIVEDAPTPRRAFAFPHAGYFGVRDGGDALIIDSGPLGPDSLPGHAHGDMLAFEWSVGGERVVVDQGVFEYVAGERRQASRSAANHNTVAAPGVDQGEFFGAFRLGRRTRLAHRTVGFDSDRICIEAGHDGFIGGAGQVRHTRLIDASASDIRVSDRLSGPLPGASASLLLSPQAKPLLNADGTVSIDGFERPVTLSANGAITIEPAVWWPDMGVEIPTSRLRMALLGSEGAFHLRAAE